MDHGKKRNAPLKTADLLSNRCTRRSFLKGVSIAAAAGSAGLVTGGCGSVASSEESKLKWQEWICLQYHPL
jgi:molybdopterin-containing oxidoreductase family iron-sulfur binding subunit